MSEPNEFTVAGWTRLAELNEYADSRSITRAQAIQELVNAGLSHWQANRD